MVTRAAPCPLLRRVRDAHQVVGEKQQSAPSGKRCRPDITILDAGGNPLAFIEVVRTHLSPQAVAVARNDIPLFVIPAPDENVVRPALGAAGWWESVPGPDRDSRGPSRRSPKGARRRLRRASEHETVEDDDGNVVWARFRGSAPDLDGMAYPAIGTGRLLHVELRSFGCSAHPGRLATTGGCSGTTVTERRRVASRVLSAPARDAPDRLRDEGVSFGARELRCERLDDIGGLDDGFAGR